MSIFLLNLSLPGQGLWDSTGAFALPPTPLPTAPPYLGCSRVWLKYKANLTYPPTWFPAAPAGFSPNPLGTDVGADEWDLQGSTHDLRSLDMDPGDYLLVRILCPSDPNGAKLRLTVVFGRGHAGTAPRNPGHRQSPLTRVYQGAQSALTVADSQPIDTSAWPSRSGSFRAWVWNLGQVAADPALPPGDPGASYSFNVGATYSPPGDHSMITLFGHDPVVRVKGGGGRKP
jgi:hypothetical protein